MPCEEITHISKICQTLKNQIHIRSRQLHRDPQPHEAAQSGSLHTTCIITTGKGKEIYSPDQIIRIVELNSASALARVRTFEQVYRYFWPSQGVEQTDAISAGWIFVCPSSQIPKTERDQRSPMRPSKAPHSAKIARPTESASNTEQ